MESNHRTTEAQISARDAIILWRPAQCYDDTADEGDVLVGTRDDPAMQVAINDNVRWPCTGGAVCTDWLRRRELTPEATFRRMVRYDRVPRERALRAFSRIEGFALRRSARAPRGSPKPGNGRPT